MFCKNKVFLCYLSSFLSLSISFARCDSLVGAVTEPLPIDWSKVSTSPVVGSTGTDLGSCACDVTVNQCDGGCCCDADCPTSNIFPECWKPPSASPQIHLCPWSPLVATNHVLGLSNDGTCLVYENDPDALGYFPDPGLVPNDAVFSELYSHVPFRFDLSPLSSENPVYMPNQVYQYQTPLMAEYQRSTTMRGLLTLPQPMDNGLCNDQTPTTFLRSFQTQCVRVYGSSLDSACTNDAALDVKTYTEGINVLKVPNDPSNVPVRIASVLCMDGNGMLGQCCSSGNDIVGCTGGQDLQTLWSNSSGIGLPSPRWQASSKVCVNAVAGLNYTIVYEKNIVKQVSVTVIFANITHSTFQQQVAVQFTSTSNLAYPRSGNMGYQWGLPVLFAQSTSQNSLKAMTFTPSPYFGITLPSMRPDTQQCTGAQSSDLPFRIPIRFGESSISGCVLRYDWNTITTQCDAIRKAVFKYQMGELNTALTHVGRFGNSSYLATEDWIPILNQKVPESLTGNQTAGSIVSSEPGTCAAILTDFRIQFIYIAMGSLSNPQYAITGVRFDYVSGSFIYQCTSVDCARQTNVAKSFSIRATVSFVRADERGYDQLPLQPSMSSSSGTGSWFFPLRAYTSQTSRTGMTLSPIVVSIIAAMFVVLQ